ncbi:pyridoxamine 5'-phosphate oxidase family protein [Saccharospirillum salsuginis]|uniref:Pyridoxamine 5'-phosphate oxidase-like FMN-binding protein n=1 Tax=Saccharospirillum salsuginis TaxID=418750 RepID=A0A918K2D6_9GAMM|nr:pyridoxamine 5'-phosphate oxidase family protein [Saccharospirillum salsuginis]GGX39632.1 pyridoxamine 5'-phosphate oxidase-like FMN-binding protein [Saccharospirillum salsuginis]
MKIESVDQLRELYGTPKEKAVRKQLSHLEGHSKRYIGLSPFVVVSTYDAAGHIDVSPRGGDPGFVSILNDRQLLIPDVKGNKRLDNLVNIIETGRIGTCFMVPGVDETLRVNGRASLTVDPDLLALYPGIRNKPISGILIDIEEVFLHCAKAFMRSRLWSTEARIERSELPTMGQMLKDQIQLDDTPETQEEMLARYRTEL